VIKLDQINIWL